MTQESQSSLPSPIQEKELPPPKPEGQISASQETLLSAPQELSGTDRLMEIINRLSGEEKKQEVLAQQKVEASKQEENLKEKKYTNFAKRFEIEDKLKELQRFKSILHSKTAIPGMTQSESEVYRTKITSELLDILGLNENASIHSFNSEFDDKLVKPTIVESEELNKREADTKSEIQEMTKTKMVDILENGKVDSIAFSLGKCIENSIESQKMNKDEIEHTFMDNCLAVFTTNPQNLELMNETILNNGEKFFLDNVKEHFYQKIANKFPENYKERVRRTVSDKVDFNYGQYRLQQFISKNPEIGNLIDKAKWLEYYTQSEGRMRENLELLKIQLSESKIDLNSNIQIGEKQIQPHKNNAVSYELTLEETKKNLHQAEIDINHSKTQIITLQDELNKIPKPGFFNKLKIEQQKTEMSQKIEDLKRKIVENQNKRMEMSANEYHVFKVIGNIEECITRIGFSLEKGSKTTVGDFISKIDNFMKNPKLTEDERKMAKKYVQIRLPMDQIANKYFLHREYSYWTGDEQGESNILGWEHIGK